MEPQNSLEVIEIIGLCSGNNSILGIRGDIIQVYRISDDINLYYNNINDISEIVSIQNCNNTDDRELIRQVDVQYRALVKAFLHARKTYISLTWQEFPEWFRSEHRPTVIERYKQLLKGLDKSLNDAHTTLVGAYENERRAYNGKQKTWRNQLNEAEKAYRSSLSKAVECQWNLGPELLVKLEDDCRANKIECSSIPWDPARMVGWKLRVRLPNLNAEAFTIVAGVQQAQGINQNNFDGSLFADHIYYLALIDERKNHTSPRQATLDVMTRFIGANDLIRLAHSEGIKITKDMTEIADNILIRWGWKPEEIRDMGPLSACIINTDGRGEYALQRDAVYVRQRVESFFKDLIWICLSKLPDIRENPRDIINTRCPEFKIGEQDYTLESIVESTTIGGGIMLLNCLLHLLFPEKGQAIGSFLEAARDKNITDTLNHRAAHDRGPPISEDEKTGIAQRIAAMLTTSEEIVGELPWHFTVTSRFGTQPMVLSGHAWSHSHPEERIIRVLAMNEAPLSDQTLVWNPSRTNPVMTEASFLR